MNQAHSNEPIEWLVTASDGQQYGPTAPTVFAQWIAAGRVAPDTLVWRTGWPEWRAAGEVEDLLPARLVRSAAPPPPPMAGGPVPVPVDGLVPGVTLPPDGTQATEAAAKPSRGRKPLSYADRRARAAQRRRWLTVVLAVFCFGLAAMLVWLVTRS